MPHLFYLLVAALKWTCSASKVGRGLKVEWSALPWWWGASVSECSSLLAGPLLGTMDPCLVGELGISTLEGLGGSQDAATNTPAGAGGRGRRLVTELWQRVMTDASGNNYLTLLVPTSAKLTKPSMRVLASGVQVSAKQGQVPKRRRAASCYAWNDDRPCVATPCHFGHICTRCGGDHCKPACPLADSSGSLSDPKWAVGRHGSRLKFIARAIELCTEIYFTYPHVYVHFLVFVHPIMCSVYSPCIPHSSWGHYARELVESCWSLKHPSGIW